MNNIFGSGSPFGIFNYTEFYCQAVMMLLGQSLWSYIIGSICGISRPRDA